MEINESLNEETENVDIDFSVAEIAIETTCDEDELDMYTDSDNNILTPTSVVVMISEDSDDTSGDECKTLCKRKHEVPLKFLDTNPVITFLLESESDTTTVEDKHKKNYYFLLKYDESINTCASSGAINSKSYEHIDNYENWENTKIKKYHYIYVNEKFKYIEYSAGTYLLRSSPYVGKKGVRMPMPKQPSPKNILIIKKINCIIKGDVKRRISLIEQFPAGIKPKQRNLMLVEYIEDSVYDSEYAKTRKRSQKEDMELKSHDKKAHHESFFGTLKHKSVLEEITEFHRKSCGKNNGLFLESHDLIQTLLNAQTTFGEIPNGVKEDEYFVIDNEENYQRTLYKKTRKFVDDCGVWKNSASNKHFYGVVDDKYIPVCKVDDEYEVASKQLKLCYPEKIESSQIIVLHKYYGSLKRAPEYKRRVSWIDKFPDNVVPKHVALIEYIGKYPDFEVPHGNQKKSGGSPYVRTSTKMVYDMKDKLATKSPEEALMEYSKLENVSNSITLKQLQNLRYRSNSKINSTNGRDEEHMIMMKNLLSLVHENHFVQQTVFTKGKTPTIICYSSQQITFLRNFSREKFGFYRMFGVDRTVTLGVVSLTFLTYKHPNLLCRKNLEPAVMMGPILFHIDRSLETYNIFFNHIRSCITSSEKNDFDGVSLLCNSEDEESILQALDYAFPSSVITQPSEHLKANLKEFLSAKSGFSNEKVEEITNEIFHDLISCSEQCDFEVKLMHIQADYDSIIPSFSFYISKLAEKIRHNLRQPMISWSSETCQALGSILCSVKGETGLKLPELILKIQQIVSIQEQNELLALHDEGHFVLAGHAKKYQTNRRAWKAKTQKQRTRMLESFRKVKPVRNGPKHIRL